MDNLRVNTLLIGAGRSGTTSLHALLEQHPEVCFSYLKEVHYFSIEELFDRGEKYYHGFLNHFKGEKVIASADTYLFPAKEAIRRIRDYNPDMKLLVMLRDPVRRAWSSYHYSVNYGHHEAYDSFLESMEKEKDIEAENRIDKLNNLGHFYCGLYFRHLNMWLKSFPRDQVLIMETRRMKEDPGSFRQELYNFLGIKSEELEITRQNAAAVPRNRKLEKFLLDRNQGGRKLIRAVSPRFLRDWVMRSGIVDRLHSANRRQQETPVLPEEVYREAMCYFEEDLKFLKKSYGCDPTGPV